MSYELFGLFVTEIQQHTTIKTTSELRHRRKHSDATLPVAKSRDIKNACLLPIMLRHIFLNFV